MSKAVSLLCIAVILAYSKSGAANEQLEKAAVPKESRSTEAPVRERAIQATLAGQSKDAINLIQAARRAEPANSELMKVERTILEATKAIEDLASAKRQQSLAATEAGRLEKNASVADRPNVLIPKDTSNHQRAEAMRAQAQRLQKEASERLRNASERYRASMEAVKYLNQGLARLAGSAKSVLQEKNSKADSVTNENPKVRNQDQAMERPTRQLDNSATARDAADGYIETMKKQGIIFTSQYLRTIEYNFSPRQTEIIYYLDYKTNNGNRLLAPYTITVKESGGGWLAIGGTPGNRAVNLNTDPVIGRDGIWRRSPMEQMIGGAMGRSK